MIQSSVPCSTIKMASDINLTLRLSVEKTSCGGYCIFCKKVAENGLPTRKFILSLQKTSSHDIRFEIKFHQFIA